MPTTKPRLYVTLPDDLRDDLQALAAVQEKPISTTVVDLLRELQPQIQGLAKLIGHAKAGNRAAAKKTLAHMVGDTLADVLQQQMELHTAPTVDLRKARRAARK